MKTKVLPILLLPLSLATGDLARAQGTAFMYQGRLTAGGTPASGSYDLRFTLFSSSSGFNQVGSMLTNSGVSVSNGLFTTACDFGPGVFSGTSLWLEVDVRTNGAGAFSALGP